MSYPFPSWGYVVIDLNLDNKTLHAAYAEATRAKNQSVFREVGSEYEDAHRFQAPIHTASRALKTIRKHVTEVSTQLDQSWTVCNFAFMLSTPGGMEQEAHQDYTPEELFAARQSPGSIPASAIIALMHGTQLKVYPGCFDTIDASGGKLVQIPRGFGIIFRADLVHCGTGYTSENYRMHCYLNLGANNCTPETVTSASVPIASCLHCGRIGLVGEPIPQHRYMCKNNEDADARRASRLARDREPPSCPLCLDRTFTASGLRSHRSRVHTCST